MKTPNNNPYYIPVLHNATMEKLASIGQDDLVKADTDFSKIFANQIRKYLNLLPVETARDLTIDAWTKLFTAPAINTFKRVEGIYWDDDNTLENYIATLFGRKLQNEGKVIANEFKNFASVQTAENETQEEALKDRLKILVDGDCTVSDINDSINTVMRKIEKIEKKISQLKGEDYQPIAEMDNGSYSVEEEADFQAHIGKVIYQLRINGTYTELHEAVLMLMTDDYNMSEISNYLSISNNKCSACVKDIKDAIRDMAIESARDGDTAMVDALVIHTKDGEEWKTVSSPSISTPEEISSQIRQQYGFELKAYIGA